MQGILWPFDTEIVAVSEPQIKLARCATSWSYWQAGGPWDCLLQGCVAQAGVQQGSLLEQDWPQQEGLDRSPTWAQPELWCSQAVYLTALQ